MDEVDELKDELKSTRKKLSNCEVQHVQAAEHQKHVNDCLLEIKDSLHGIKVAFDGNGRVGIKTRIDRLEQVEKNRKWTMRTLITAMSAMLVKMISDVFHTGNH